MRFLVAGLTPYTPLKARETVAKDTCASFAMSFIVICNAAHPAQEVCQTFPALSTVVNSFANRRTDDHGCIDRAVSCPQNSN
jgi:hypothetical protein